MSRWLKSVNTILEKLDDRVETAVIEGKQNESDEGGSSYDDDDEDYSDDDDDAAEYDDDNNNNANNDDDNDLEEIVFSNNNEKQENNGTEPQRQHLGDGVVKEGLSPMKDKQGSGDTNLKTEVLPSNIVQAKEKSEETEKVNKSLNVTPSKATIGKELASFSETKQPESDPSRSIPNPPRSADHQNQQRRMVALRSQTSNASIASQQQQQQQQPNSNTAVPQQEFQRLLKQNAMLKSQLEVAQTELLAQNKELEDAALRITEERQMADDERQELLDEHEDALRNLRSSYETRLFEEKQVLEKVIEDLRLSLATEAKMRAKEGGDMTQDLGDAIFRERQALLKVDQLEKEKIALEQNNAKLKSTEGTLRDEIKRLGGALQTAIERERLAEERLDVANDAHQRAIAHRQAREAELEITVAELGAALAERNYPNNTANSYVSDGNMAEAQKQESYRKKYDLAMEELESCKALHKMANLKCEALQKELLLLSRERTDEAAKLREQERQYDEKVEQLTSKMSRLEASLREYKAKAMMVHDSSFDATGAVTSPPESGGGPVPVNSNNNNESSNIRHLKRDLDQARRHISSLSDQLLRQKGQTESAKAEVLALRGRLHSATLRAETAEQQQLAGASNTVDRILDLEGGNAYDIRQRQRRRIKTRGGAVTMRSALGLKQSYSSDHPLAQTVDALDVWMLETGVILKNEPMARLALLVYFLIVHLWCFGLVFFHAVESEHADLGSLTARRPEMHSVGQDHS